MIHNPRDGVIRFSDIAKLKCLNRLRINSLTSACSQLAASTSLSTISCMSLDLLQRDVDGNIIVDAKVRLVASVTRVSNLRYLWA